MPSHRFPLLLVLLAGLLTAAHAVPQSGLQGGTGTASPNLALPAKNAILHVQVDRTPEGGWAATVEYHFNGSPQGARLEIKQSVTRGAVNLDPTLYRAAGTVMEKGRHRVQLVLERPADDVDRFTQQIVVEMRDEREAVIASATLNQKFEWQDAVARILDGEASVQRPDIVLRRAVGLIDTGERSALRQAKVLLERLVQREPDMDQAYVELARIAMKTNWSPDGLRDAEALIKSALQIRPDSVNARILLGYVYANQGRHKEGVALYEEAARVGTTNLWLWTNWGELLVAQGQDDAAIAKFREAIKGPPTGDTNDRARQQAYSGLFELHGKRGDLDALDALHRRRRVDYPGAGCYSLAHARFLVTQRGDAAAADAILKTLPPTLCDSGEGRMLTALVRYMRWAKAKEPERAEALRLARVVMPVSPHLFYVLAESEHTAVAARQLVAAGEKVTMQDNQRMDALAYALAAGDNAAAGRLLGLGARTDVLVGPDQMPVSLLPVIYGNYAGIELMQRAGVDYTVVRFRGQSAVDMARQDGDEQLLRALNARGRRL